MHCHLEIIMPPTDDVEAAVKTIMAPFDENQEDDKYAFWDWYEIGGRWSGCKVEARIGADKLTVFREELVRRKVTVSGIQFGKQELDPPSQSAEVDALWQEWFPDSGLSKCPMFKHAGSRLLDDVCTVESLPLDLTAARVIFAGAMDGSPLKAQAMLQTKFWNGVSYVKTAWDGTMRSALMEHSERLEIYSDKAREAYGHRPDWLCVTVDYHS